ncbi:hypothetical protein DUI87_28520 [Hirundo rustica rustica]|uniref:ribonuclease H n=1 Tax=Hirundo rustica rustica TaxID=333673 RepID=A0A3M0J1P7_HIRRU|nr:hypothetical protein DUI87_28520 [Hirundo rustica rustica]
MIPIHKMIRELESQGVVSKTHSPFNSPIWPVRKPDGEWRLTVDYRALNEVTPPLSAAVPDMLELQYELESKAAKWYATIDIANAFFSIPLAAECRPQFAFTWRGVQYTWNRLPRGWKHSPTISHGLIQAALEKGEIIQILLEASFAIKKSKVKRPAREIQFLGVKWQDGRQQIPTEVINKITAISPPTSKKGTQAFLGAIGFWRMHIPEYSQIVSPLYLVTRKKNDFHWSPEQQQAFAQIKQEIAHAVALGPVRTGSDVKNVLYSAAGKQWPVLEPLAEGMNRKWKAAVWSPTRQVAQATEGEGGLSQLAELKAVQLALDIAEREKWPKLYLYTDSWMIDAHVPKSQANEEHRNNEQVDQAAEIEVSKIGLDWQHKGELFLARWAHDVSGHQGRDATYKWARDRGVDLTMDSISQVIHDCETCPAIKQAKWVKPLGYGGRWSKYKYGEAWQIDYITLPQTRQGKRYVLTMVKATTGWLETYPVPHATARITLLGLEKQVLWRHGTPERIELDNRTHFKNSLINTWAREHGIEWIYHIPYCAPAARKVERYNGLLKTTLKALGKGTFKN